MVQELIGVYGIKLAWVVDTYSSSYLMQCYILLQIVVSADMFLALWLGGKEWNEFRLEVVGIWVQTVGHASVLVEARMEEMVERLCFLAIGMTCIVFFVLLFSWVV